MDKDFPIPENEAERLKALSKYNILDTLSEEEFDRLTKLASIICGVPIALIGLIDQNRQWFKSKIGLEGSETPRELTFCQYAITDNKIMQVQDATKDSRFVDNPFVTGEPDVRFYAGYPLIDPDGYALGTLCVIDKKANALTTEQQEALALLAEEVVSQIVARQKNAEKDKLEKLFNLSVDLICLVGSDGYLRKVNPSFISTLGWSMEELINKPIFDFVHPDDIAHTVNSLEKLRGGEKTVGFETRCKAKNGEYLKIRWVANPDLSTKEMYVIGRYDLEKQMWEKNLLVSEEKHRTFFENSQALMCMHDLDGNFISINPAGAASVGYTVEELRHKGLLDIIPPDTEPMLRAYLYEIERKGTLKGLMNVLHKNGSTRTWMFNNIIAKGVAGRYVIGTAVDITERTILEREIKESNNRFLKVFDKNPVSMVLSNYETAKIEYVNEVFLETFGFKKEDVIGKTSVELNIVSAADRQKDFVLMQQKGSLRSVERHVSKANREKLWALVSLEVVQINEGSFILSSFYNIDQRKKLEEEMSRLAEFQKVILDGTEYSIITTSEPDGIIRSFNKGAEKMLGYKAEEMIGKTPAIIHDQSEVEARAEVLSKELGTIIKPGVDVFHIKSRQNNISDVNEWTYIAKDGTRIPVELSISTLRRSDKSILGYLGIAKDISENKKVKDAIIQAKEKAEQAVIAKNSFLANMSHEIRTPMNAIIGYTDLLAQSNLDEEQREHVSFVKTAGTNLLSIINDILDFSKIESGKIALESVPFSLKDTLKAIYNLLKVRAIEKNLEYNFFLDTELPEYVTGDSVRLNQILVNLIGNAIKFTARGHVTVSVKKIEEDAENYKLKFIVQDSGIGIPADKIDQIFERFTQANTETTRKFGGTGLGLSIAKNLVELQGGKMELKSEMGKGSEFSFEISYKKATNTDIEPIQRGFVPAQSLNDVKILLCEDNVLNQKLAKRVIAKFGIDVEIAENGRVGIEKLKENKYDLVLMDLQMPEMDGYQAVLEIRNELHMTVPIIAMTAHSLVGEKEKCLEIGMNDYIGKPFTQEDLYYKICSNLPEQEKVKAPAKLKEKKVGGPNAIHALDLNSLKEFSGGNRQFEKELIELFLQHVPEDLKALEQAFKESNVSVIKSLSHKLQSSISVVGLGTLMDDLRYMESNASEKGERETSYGKFCDIKSVLTENCALLKKKLIEEY